MQEAAAWNAQSHGGLKAPRAACVALATFVGVLCLMLLPSRASAAVAAPMCNELAQSIEAPPTIWPHHGGSIRAAPSCPNFKLWQVNANSDHAERIPPIVLREAPVGTLSGQFEKPGAVRVLVARATRLVLHPGHVGSVYRPPRA